MLNLRRRFAISIMLSLTLLIAGTIGFGVAIQQGSVAAPRLDIRYGTMWIVGYTTHNPECAPYMPCPPDAGEALQAYYVIWSIRQLPTPDQPYGRTARRVLVVALKRQWKHP
jgi:hypothetical protein